MKGSDFFKKLNETLGITIPEETLTKLSEIEVPDELQAKHQEIFISKERAKHEPEIIEAITKEDRKTQFRIVDEKIKTFLPLIGQDQATVITNTFETYKKLDMLTTAVGDAIKGAKGKVSEDVRKVEEEWAAKVRQKEEDFAKQIAAKETEFKDKQVENIMRSKLLSYKHLESYGALIFIKDHFNNDYKYLDILRFVESANKKRAKDSTIGVLDRYKLASGKLNDIDPTIIINRIVKAKYIVDEFEWDFVSASQILKYFDYDIDYRKQSSELRLAKKISSTIRRSTRLGNAPSNSCFACFLSLQNTKHRDWYIREYGR